MTTQASTPYRLYASAGCGSAIAEALFSLAGLPVEIALLDYELLGPSRAGTLQALNPLGQVPTLVLPDGSVMAESAAITLHVGDVAPAACLVPAAGDPQRPAFLRWLVFLVAAVYPTFTYGDEPSRWVAGEAAGQELRASTDHHRQALWRHLDGQVKGPWFLGEAFSALDLYVAIMTRWRPRRDWFADACPRLTAIAHAVDAKPELAAVWARNFG